MSKHTPGPWSVYDGLGETLAVCIGDEANGKRPCIVDWPGFDSCDLPFGQQLANAHLIAAAPDLLAALKGITRFCDAVRVQVGMGKTQLARLEQARAAIAKAEGRTLRETLP